MNPPYEITATSWLVSGQQRIRLDTVERYEQRDRKVLLFAQTVAPGFAVQIELDDAAAAAGLMTVLDAHFTPPAP